jgi:hypothetical protein
MENNLGSESDDGNGKDHYSFDVSSSNECETLVHGTSAFMHWLNSEDKTSLTGENIIVLLKFINDRHTVLYDRNLHTQLDVEINNGVPFCKYCKQDDCAHVGFAICVEQLYGHRRSGTEEKIEDIIGI